MSLSQILNNVYDGNVLFFKFYYMPVNNDIIDFAILPGEKEGISAADIWSYNIGINNAISEERKKRSAIALSYINSKQIQRKMTMEKKFYSAITSLYDEKEVCEILNCSLFKQIQPIVLSSIINNNYIEYSEKVYQYFYEYMFENETSAKKTLKRIVDINKIYTITLDTQDTSIGLIFFITIIVITFIIIMSFFIFLINSILDYFDFIPIDFWILIVVGTLMVLVVGILNIGKVTAMKCYFKQMILSLGYLLNVIPILYKFITEYLYKSKFALWMNSHFSHRYLFLLGCISVNLIFSFCKFFFPYDIETLIINDGQNFQICKMNSIYGKIFVFLNYIYIFIVILICFLLIIKERKVEKHHFIIGNLFPIIYLDSFFLIIYYIISLLHIYQFFQYFILHESILILFAISNYSVLLYVTNIIIKNNNEYKHKQKTTINLVKLKFETNYVVTTADLDDSNNSFNTEFTDSHINTFSNK